MSKLCGAAHPDLPGLRCGRPGEGAKANHIRHTDHYNNEWIDWDNSDYEAPEPKVKHGQRTPLKFKDEIHDIAERVKGGTNE